MNKDIDQSIFEDMPVPKALAAMALPTILSQLITTVYNLADAFFISALMVWAFLFTPCRAVSKSSRV
mgnify:CR=1 FL=1